MPRNSKVLNFCITSLTFNTKCYEASFIAFDYLIKPPPKVFYLTNYCLPLVLAEGGSQTSLSRNHSAKRTENFIRGQGGFPFPTYQMTPNPNQGGRSCAGAGGRGPPPKSFDSDENFKPEHTLFCRKLRFVTIYALLADLWAKKCLYGVSCARSALLHGIY